MTPQPPRLLVSELTGRIYLVTRYAELEGGAIVSSGRKVDMTSEVGRAVARLDELGLELRPAPADDHSASRRVDVLEREAPHLIAPADRLGYVAPIAWPEEEA